MSLRKIAEFRCHEKTARVYRDSEWEEFRVRFYAHGTHLDGSDYMTADREDAIATACLAVEDERSWVREHAA